MSLSEDNQCMEDLFLDLKVCSLKDTINFFRIPKQVEEAPEASVTADAVDTIMFH